MPPIDSVQVSAYPVSTPEATPGEVNRPASADEGRQILRSALAAAAASSIVFSSDSGIAAVGIRTASPEERPLIGPGAETARRAEALLSDSASLSDKLEALGSLAQKARESGSPEAVSVTDGVFRTLLTKPLHDAVRGMPAGIADALCTMTDMLFERLMTAQSVGTLEQALTEVDALGETLRREGRLTPEASAALSELDILLTHKAGTVGVAAIIEGDVSQLESGAGGNIRELYDAAVELIGRTDSTGFGRPACGHIVLSVLNPRMQAISARLTALSDKRSEPVALKADFVEAEGLKDGADFKALRTKLSKAKADLSRLSGQLLTHREADLSARLSALEGGLDAAELCVRVRDRSLKTVSVAEMKSLGAELEAMQNRQMPGEYRKLLGQTVSSVIGRTADLHSQALASERQFLLGMERLSESGDYEALHREVAQHLSTLDGDSGTAANLTAEERRQFSDALREADQQALVREFGEQIEAAGSARMDAPGLFEISERFKASALTGSHRADTAAALAEASSSGLSRLDDRLTELKNSLESMTTDQIRDIDVGGLMEEAGRRLLPDDLAQFGRSLNAFMASVDAALLANVSEELGGNLNSDAMYGLGVLMRSAAYHPSMTAALAEASPELLQDIGIAAQGRSADAGLLDRIDSLLLGHPELDDALAEVKERLVSSDRKEEVVLSHASLCVRRDLMTSLKGMLSPAVMSQLGLSGEAVSVDLLERMVTLAGAGDGGLSQADMMLVRALWYAKKAEGVGFAAFRSGLPDVYQSEPGLERLLETGLKSRKQMQAVGADIRRLARGFDGNADLLKVCERLTTSNDRWAAGASLTRLTRNVLHGLSFTGRQAMEGGASAMRGAIERSLFADKGRGETAADALRVFFGRADESALNSFSQQMTAFCAGHEALSAELTGLQLRQAELAVAKNALMSDSDRQNMLGVLRACRPDDETVEQLAQGRPGAVRGAVLSMGVLILEEILSDTSKSFGELQTALDGIKFQSRIDFDRMEGSLLVTAKKNDKGFSEKFEALRTAKDESAFAAARDDMLAFLRANNAHAKAEAVLYFKDTYGRSGTESVDRKFAQAYRYPRLDGIAATYADHILKTVEVKLASRFGVESGFETQMKAAAKLRDSAVEQMEKAFSRAERAFSGHVLETIGRAADAALCEAFLAQTTCDSAEELAAERDRHSPLTEWQFCRDVIAQMEKIGIPHEAAEVFAVRELMDLPADRFTRLEKTMSRDPVLAMRQLMIDARTPDEMKAVVKEGAFRRVTSEMIEMLADPGKTLTLSAERSASACVPVLETGAGDVSVHLSAAVRNGMSLWRSEDGACHITLMRSRNASVGIGIESLLDIVEAKAEGAFGIGTGCDLVFRSADNCCEFLTALLAGTADGSHLALADSVSRATEFGISGSIEVSAQTDVKSLIAGEEESDDGVSSADGDDEEEDAWGGISSSFSADSSVLWKTSENADGTIRTRTRAGHLSIGIGLTVAPEDITEKAASAAEKAGDHGFRNLEARIGEVLERNEFEAALVDMEFEDRERIETMPGGKIRSADVVRILHPEDAQEAVALLEAFGAGESCRRAVLQDAKKLDGGFTLEVVRRLPQSVADRLNRNNQPLDSLDKCRLAEVRLIGEEVSSTERFGLSTEHLSLIRTMGGGLSKTIRYSTNF